MTTAQDPAVEAADSAALLALIAQATDLPKSGPIIGEPTGEIRVTLATGETVLPRPLFGQIKVLIRGQSRFAAAIDALELKRQANRNEIREEHKAYQGDADDGNVTPTLDNLDALAKLRDRTQAVGDEIQEALEAALVEWWTLVFGTLTDEVPPEELWPAVMIDASLPSKMVNHWRYAPAGPG